MKLVKTRLRSQLGDDTLVQAMRVCIEGPERLINEKFGGYYRSLEGTKNLQTSCYYIIP